MTKTALRITHRAVFVIQRTLLVMPREQFLRKARTDVSEIAAKQVIGCTTIAHISPPVSEAMNVHLSFEEALKLYFGLGQLLGKLNGYNRRTSAGKRAAANLCIYPHRRRITLNEGKLRTSKKSHVPADADE